MNKLNFEIQRTSEGFMVACYDTGEYLHDCDGNNCFDSEADVLRLISELGGEALTK